MERISKRGSIRGDCNWQCCDPCGHILCLKRIFKCHNAFIQNNNKKNRKNNDKLYNALLFSSALSPKVSNFQFLFKGNRKTRKKLKMKKYYQKLIHTQKRNQHHGHSCSLIIHMPKAILNILLAG